MNQLSDISIRRLITKYRYKEIISAVIFGLKFL